MHVWISRRDYGLLVVVVVFVRTQVNFLIAFNKAYFCVASLY